jgi:hypothetical protein
MKARSFVLFVFVVAFALLTTLMPSGTQPAAAQRTTYPPPRQYYTNCRAGQCWINSTFCLSPNRNECLAFKTAFRTWTTGSEFPLRSNVRSHRRAIPSRRQPPELSHWTIR